MCGAEILRDGPRAWRVDCGVLLHPPNPNPPNPPPRRAPSAESSFPSATQIRHAMIHRSTLARTLLAAFPFILASCSPAANPRAASPAAPASPALFPVVPPKVSFVVGRDDHTLVRLDNDKPTWPRRFDDRLGGVRDPHIVSDDTRVFLTSCPHLIALDAKTGSPLWTSDGPTDRLFLSGNLLLATDCSVHDGPNPEPRFVMARVVDTGAKSSASHSPQRTSTPSPSSKSMESSSSRPAKRQTESTPPFSLTARETSSPGVITRSFPACPKRTAPSSSPATNSSSSATMERAG